MQIPTNESQRLEAITRLVKKLSADEQKVLYRELAKAKDMDIANKIKSSVSESGRKHLSMAEIVAECKAARKKRP
jgi:hypothetical protein